MRELHGALLFHTYFHTASNIYVNIKTIFHFCCKCGAHCACPNNHLPTHKSTNKWLIQNSLPGLNIDVVPTPAGTFLFLHPQIKSHWVGRSVQLNERDSYGFEYAQVNLPGQNSYQSTDILLMLLCSAVSGISVFTSSMVTSSPTSGPPDTDTVSRGVIALLFVLGFVCCLACWKKKVLLQCFLWRGSYLLQSYCVPSY